jgi:hypothetical protein
MSHLSPVVLFVDDDADTREMYQLALNLSCTGSELTVSFNELRCAGPPGG